MTFYCEAKHSSIWFALLVQGQLGKYGTPVHMFIHAVIQLANYMAAAQCLKSFRFS